MNESSNLFNLLTQSFTLAFSVGAIGILYKVSSTWGRTEAKIDHLVECHDEIKAEVKQHRQDFKDLRDGTSELKGAIEKIKGKLDID